MAIQWRALQFSRADQTFAAAGDSLDFGFIASKIIIANGSSKSTYWTWTTTVASTSGYEVRTSETLVLDQMRTQCCAFCATSSGAGLRLAAWGG